MKLPTYILPLLPAFAIALAAQAPMARRLCTIAFTALVLWSGLFLASGSANHLFGRQASVRDLCAGTALAVSQDQPGELFVSGARVHGVEFYTDRLVGVIRNAADIVLPLSAAESARVFKNAAACARHYSKIPAYGIMTRETRAKYFNARKIGGSSPRAAYVLVTNIPSK